MLEGDSSDIDLEKLDILINRSKAFKFIVKTVGKVQDKLDLLEWKEEVHNTLKELDEFMEVEKKGDIKEENKDEDKDKSTPSKQKKIRKNVTLEVITRLISDGQNKGFADSKEMVDLQNLIQEVNKYKAKALAIFELLENEEFEEDSDISGSKRSASKSKSGKKERVHSLELNKQISDANWNKKSYYKDKGIIKNIPIETVRSLIKEGENFHLKLHIVEIMQAEIEEVEEWISDAKTILDKEKNTNFKFSQIEELYNEVEDFRIKCDEVDKIRAALYPIIAWKREASKFIEKHSVRPKMKEKKKLDPFGNKCASKTSNLQK